jgi:hypothetical protein
VGSRESEVSSRQKAVGSRESKNACWQLPAADFFLYFYKKTLTNMNDLVFMVQSN